MTKKEISEFLMKNPVFSLATCDGRKPRVRSMMLYRADENGIIFNTGRDKDVNKQLKANPAVEMCFYNAEQGLQIRIEGTVEAIDDPGLREQIVEDFPFLKPWVEKDGYEVLMPYRVRGAKATTWTMETNFEPKEFIEL